ncbi:MAG TPA: SdiA-regulated domain-containing protein [Segetibacter sp.]|jgi:uncharacterized protein YjiK
MFSQKILIFLGCIFVFSCDQKSKKQYPTLPGYDLASPVVIHLRSELDEISGLHYYPKDTSIFAINDETGLLYKIYIRNKVEIERWKFAEGGDFEDIQLVDSTFYILKSNGNITYFKVLSKDSVLADKAKFREAEKNEFEILYYDDNWKKLVLICKDCEGDNNKSVTAWSFNPSTKEYDKEPYFELDAEEITKRLETDKNKFKPSAAAIHPVTKELYIVSSVNKALVISDRVGNIKNVIPLDPKIFKQPEGITFTPGGDLIISNEAADIGAANILIFKVKAQLK